MAYEAGANAENYIGECIDRYRNDPSVFTRSIQLINMFTTRPDWPHCFDEMDKAVMHILGESLVGLIFGFTQRYLHDDEMEWPEDLPHNFKEELIAFHLATDTIVSQFWMGRTRPMKLFSIAQSLDSSDGHRIIRFIRMDGAFLDVEMDEGGMGEIIRMLNELEGNKGEAENAGS